MPKVDPIFIIGVIREKEKNFLQNDEYIRLMENRNALRDTPYGKTVSADITLASADQAIEHHLREELQWLTSYLDNDQILAYMAARYDAMNIVSAITQRAGGSKTLQLPSALGSIPQDTLFTAIWDNNVKPLRKSAWKNVIEQEVNESKKENWHASQLLGRMSAHYATIVQKLAFTPLTKQLAAMAAHRSDIEMALRLPSKKTVAEIARRVKGWGHLHVTEEILAQVKNQISATAYELAWDKEMMAAVSPYRFHVSGYDPIIAYWVAKQIESQNVRFMIAGQLSGVDAGKIKSLLRPYYQPSSI